MKKIKYEITSKAGKHGMLALYITCHQYSKTLDIDTNVRIFADEWDAKNGFVINNPNAKQLNIFIRKTIYDLEGYEMAYDGEFTLSKLYEIWRGREATHDFYSLMKFQIEERSIRQSTKDIHKRILAHLIKYKAECNISELTDDYVKGFIKYMQEIGLSAGTIAMHIHGLRCYYNIARKMFGNKVPVGSFEFYHETKEQQIAYKMKSLTDDDIRLLENYVVKESTSEYHRLQINRFLFMSYTGTRISDFMSLSKNNITVENGVMWLSYTSVKTDTPVRIPISAIFDGRAEQILTKYESDLDNFFRIPRKSSFNGILNSAVKKSGIGKHLTAHTAKHHTISI